MFSVQSMRRGGMGGARSFQCLEYQRKELSYTEQARVNEMSVKGFKRSRREKSSVQYFITLEWQRQATWNCREPKKNVWMFNMTMTNRYTMVICILFVPCGRKICVGTNRCDIRICKRKRDQRRDYRREGRSDKTLGVLVKHRPIWRSNIIVNVNMRTGIA